MEAVSTVHANRVSVKLHNGTKQGVIQVVGVNLGTLNQTGFDSTKVLNIVDALENCLDKSVVRIEHIQTNYLSRV